MQNKKTKLIPLEVREDLRDEVLFIHDYYRNNINPPLWVYTINQVEIHRFQKEDNWLAIAVMLKEVAIGLQNVEVASVLFCANTLTKFLILNKANQVLSIYIGDITAKVIKCKAVIGVGFQELFILWKLIL